MSRLYKPNDSGLRLYQQPPRTSSFVRTRDNIQLQGGRKRSNMIPGEKGILKPRSKEKGIFNKLSKFFNQYLLTGYENNTNIDDLENSLSLSGFKGVDTSKTIKKLNYDEHHYDDAPLPMLPRESYYKPKKPFEKPPDTHSSTRRNFGSKTYIKERDSELVRKLNDELRSRTHDVKKLVDEVDDTNYNLKRAVRELHVSKGLQELMSVEINHLKNRNTHLTKENSELLNKLQQINQENIRVSTEYDKLNKDLEQLNNQNIIANDEILHLKLKNADLEEDMLTLRLDSIQKSYELKLSHLYNEYIKFNLIDNPNLHLKYYDQINHKLQEFEAYISNDSLSNQEVVQQYDYGNISQLKSILDKLYLDLTKKFIRNTIKAQNPKIIHFLSLNYHLRSKCLTILCSLEKIMIILTYA